MKKLFRFTAAALAVIIMLTVPVLAEDNLKYIKENDASKLFNMVAGDLVDLYQFDITKDQLLTRTFTNLLNDDPEALDSFMKALFGSLDEYSEFYLPEEYQELMNSLENITGGIGVQMTRGSKYVEIVNVLENTPAEKAGVKIGDKIVKVNGEDMLGKGHDYVSGKIRGDIGTEVTLTLMRGEKQFDITIVRGEITQNTVNYVILDSGIGYMYITSFSSATDEEVSKALDEFDKNGVKKIILDLRYNPGGFVDSAVNTAKNFVPSGIIATHHMKYHDRTEEYRSDLKQKKYEMVTLVNEYTASAAELLASALQDSGASKLIGKQTYGKAVTQAILSIYNGRVCKVTSGEYITRNGKKINKIGIAPDYNVDNRTAYFIETNAKRSKFAPQYSEGDTGDGIYAAKQRLSALGYNIGVVDDKYDENMKYAVIAYQEKLGVEATGVLDIGTQIQLDNEADYCEVVIDNQLAKAFERFGEEYTGYLMDPSAQW